MDTGTGKTIMGLNHHQVYFKDKKLLIVAPASKLNEGGWQRTIKDHYPQIDYETCSYNMLPKKYKEFTDYFVIFDECHRLKNSTGKWGKAGYELTKIASGFILLSATCIPNGWEDSINYFKMFKLTKNKTSFIKEIDKVKFLIHPQAIQKIKKINDETINFIFCHTIIYRLF